MRIGLALSGGGFRATLFHLGVVRFLSDSDLLKHVSHMTSVSGGSILAAHLVLNWDRYCAPEEFEQAAQEILQFVDLDVRNRILRRYPLLIGLGISSLLFRRQRVRKITGLLEKYYQKYLFGNQCLHQLPATPELHILSTNVSGGGLSSFSRNGILIEQRSTDGSGYFKQYRAGLAKVATAVAASSAFPGFFPPIDVQAQDIAAAEGEFPTQFFTDGGVYDNLGIRMFDYLSVERKTHIDREDFLDLEACIQAWNQCLQNSERTSLRRLIEITDALSESGQGGSKIIHRPQNLFEKLDLLLKKSRLNEDTQLLKMLKTPQEEKNRAIKKLLRPELFSKRQCIAAAFKQTVGHDCLKPQEDLCDVVLVSDAGTGLSVTRSDRIPGFLSTAMRSSDILMDRVRQLERNKFIQSKQCMFISITDIVSEESDPTVLHPEIQAQVGRIRTDLDRFSELEIRALIQQGYCVARHICRSLPTAMSSSVEEGLRWEPLRKLNVSNKAADAADLNQGEKVTKVAKALQRSRNRQIVKSFLDLRDWLTWIYIPLMVVLVGVIPFFAYQNYRDAQFYSALRKNVAQMREDFGRVLELMDNGPLKNLASMEFEEVSSLGLTLEESGFNLVRETQIIDLRKWLGRAPGSSRQVYTFRKFAFIKTSESTTTASLRLPSPWNSGDLSIQAETKRFNPILRRYNTSQTGDSSGPFTWEIVLDLQGVPADEVVEFSIVMVQTKSYGDRQFEDLDWSSFFVGGQPEAITSWILLPRNSAIDNFDVVSFQNKTPDKIELVRPTHSALMENGSIIYWMLIQPEPNSTYSSRLWD